MLGDLVRYPLIFREVMQSDYPTCSETYATFRAYHDFALPGVVSDKLRIVPTEDQTIGQVYEIQNVSRTIKLSGWFLCTDGNVNSFDLEKHLEWLTSQLNQVASQLQELKNEGWRMDITCMWDSANGHGGPTLSPSTLNSLSNLGIEIWFDVYFHGAYDAIRSLKKNNAVKCMG